MQTISDRTSGVTTESTFWSVQNNLWRRDADAGCRICPSLLHEFTHPSRGRGELRTPYRTLYLQGSDLRARHSMTIAGSPIGAGDRTGAESCERAVPVRESAFSRSEVFSDRVGVPTFSIGAQRR